MFGLLKRSALAKGRIGIAVDDDRLAVAVVSRDPAGAPSLARCETHPVPKGGPEALAGALRAMDLPSAPVSGVLRARDYQLSLVESPDVPPAELRAAMRWRLRDAIDFRVEDAVIDVFDIPAQSRGTHGRMMYAVAARRSAVDWQAAAFGALAAFDVVDVPELCLRNLASLLPAAAQGIAMLHLGTDSASVVLVRGATFFFARQMNLQAGLSTGASGQLDPDNVLLELQRSLDYYERHFDQPPITRVAVAPCGERARQLAAELAHDSNFEVSVLDLNQLLTCTTPLADADQASVLMAVGAALRREQRSL